MSYPRDMIGYAGQPPNPRWPGGARVALQFVVNHPAVTTVIPGARDAGQVRGNVRAGLLPPLAAAILEGIDRVVPPAGGRKIWPA